MITENMTKKEIRSLSPEMAVLMETAIVQSTEEEWNAVLFPGNKEMNRAACAAVKHIDEATRKGVVCIYDMAVAGRLSAES